MSEQVEKMPDLVQAVVGFRNFNIDEENELALTSAGLGAYTWAPGVNRAECRAHLATLRLSPLGIPIREPPSPEDEPPAHDAPASDCGCGLYGWHDPREIVPSMSSSVPAAIAAWGAIEVHATGFRAEYAKIVAIGLSDAAWSAGMREQIEQIAARYGVRAVPLIDLEEEAYRHGIAVPQKMRPQEEVDDALIPSSWAAHLHSIATAPPLVPQFASGGPVPTPTQAKQLHQLAAAAKAAGVPLSQAVNQVAAGMGQVGKQTNQALASMGNIQIGWALTPEKRESRRRFARSLAIMCAFLAPAYIVEAILVGAPALFVLAGIMIVCSALEFALARPLPPLATTLPTQQKGPAERQGLGSANGAPLGRRAGRRYGTRAEV